LDEVLGVRAAGTTENATTIPRPRSWRHAAAGGAAATQASRLRAMMLAPCSTACALWWRHRPTNWRHASMKAGRGTST